MELKKVETRVKTTKHEVTLTHAEVDALLKRLFESSLKLEDGVQIETTITRDADTVIILSTTRSESSDATRTPTSL